LVESEGFPKLASRISNDKSASVSGSLTSQTRNIGVWIHDAKFSGSLLGSLEDEGLAWKSADPNAYGQTNWYALHPTLGKAVMTCIGLAEEEFGQERLSKLLTANAARTAEEMADLILSTVQSWAPSQTDDLTVLVCDCH
jgi:Stage II sporulation protein E (SpoIIE)